MQCEPTTMLTTILLYTRKGHPERWDWSCKFSLRNCKWLSISWLLSNFLQISRFKRGELFSNLKYFLLQRPVLQPDYQRCCGGRLQSSLSAYSPDGQQQHQLYRQESFQRWEKYFNISSRRAKYLIESANYFCLVGLSISPCKLWREDCRLGSDPEQFYLTKTIPSLKLLKERENISGILRLHSLWS